MGEFVGVEVGPEVEGEEEGAEVEGAAVTGCIVVISKSCIFITQ